MIINLPDGVFVELPETTDPVVLEVVARLVWNRTVTTGPTPWDRTDATQAGYTRSRPVEEWVREIDALLLEAMVC